MPLEPAVAIPPLSNRADPGPCHFPPPWTVARTPAAGASTPAATCATVNEARRIALGSLACPTC